MSHLPVLEIKNGEYLFRYCNPSVFPNGQYEIPLSVFMDRAMSCDWERIRKDPFTSFHIAEGRTRVIQIEICDEIRNPVNPKRVGQVVKEWHQDVIHSPVANEDDPTHGENPAHSLINGLKKVPVCEAIASKSIWFDKAK